MESVDTPSAVANPSAAHPVFAPPPQREPPTERSRSAAKSVHFDQSEPEIIPPREDEDEYGIGRVEGAVSVSMYWLYEVRTI